MESKTKVRVFQSNLSHINRYIIIQPETITSLRGSGELIVESIWVYSPEPRSDVYCFRLNFNISKLGYAFVIIVKFDHSKEIVFKRQLFSKVAQIQTHA